MSEGSINEYVVVPAVAPPDDTHNNLVKTNIAVEEKKETELPK